MALKSKEENAKEKVEKSYTERECYDVVNQGKGDKTGYI